MITEKLIEEAKKIAHDDSREFGAPSIFHIDYAHENAKRLAKELGADERIVSLGTFLMDCRLGTALHGGRLDEHVEMSAQVAEELLENDPDLTKSEKENVLACVNEHHGVKNFTSLESEICCNADSYKILSVKGVIGGMVNSRDMELEELVEFYLQKAEEKWKALSLDVCKKELESQYHAIKEFLKKF